MRFGHIRPGGGRERGAGVTARGGAPRDTSLRRTSTGRSAAGRGELQ